MSGVASEPREPPPLDHLGIGYGDEIHDVVYGPDGLPLEPMPIVQGDSEDADQVSDQPGASGEGD